MSLRLRPHKPTFLGIRRVLNVTAFVVGAFFCFSGGDLKDSATFFYVNYLPLPWWVYGSLLILAAGLILFKKTRPAGYFIGACVYTFLGMTTFLAFVGGYHLSWLTFLQYPAAMKSAIAFFATCNASTIAVLYWYAFKQAIYDNVDPERRNLTIITPTR